MRIIVRGWGRNQGETTIMSAALANAESPGDTYQRDKVYKTVEYPEHPRLTKVRVSTGAELRLGGNYLLHVELTRKEIAQLFFDTHSSAMVRMIRSFIEEEEREDLAHLRELIAERDERRRRRFAQEEKAESE
jgi:hypothetical protein